MSSIFGTAGDPIVISDITGNQQHSFTSGYVSNFNVNPDKFEESGFVGEGYPSQIEVGGGPTHQITGIAANASFIMEGRENGKNRTFKMICEKGADATHFRVEGVQG